MAKDDSDYGLVILILIIIIFGIPLAYSGGLGSGEYILNFSDTNDNADDVSSDEMDLKIEKDIIYYEQSNNYGHFPPFSGGGSSLNETLSQAGDNARVILDDDTIYVSEPVHINNDVRILGQSTRLISPNNYSGSGFVINGDSVNVTFENITMVGFNRAVSLEEHSSSFSMSNVSVYNSSRAVHSVDSSNGWFVEDSEFVNNTYGIFVDGSNSGWRVEDTDIENNKYGLYAIGTSGRWSIYRSGIRNNSVYGLYAASTDGMWVARYLSIYNNGKYGIYLSNNNGSPDINEVYWKNSSSTREVLSGVSINIDSCDKEYCGRR